MDEQVDWKAMYLTMASAAADALEVLPWFPDNMPAREILEQAGREAEEQYIRAVEP